MSYAMFQASIYRYMQGERMTLSHKDIQKISKLARIHVRQDEYDALKAQLEGVLDWVDQLQAVNTDGVAPYRDLLTHSTHERDDTVGEHDQAHAILKNAPDQAHHMFSVPKVVE